jgi:hypothetical protein
MGPMSSEQKGGLGGLPDDFCFHQRAISYQLQAHGGISNFKT